MRNKINGKKKSKVTLIKKKKSPTVPPIGALHPSMVNVTFAPLRRSLDLKKKKAHQKVLPK